MFHIKSISLLLLAALLLSACQLLEPLPTLPPVLTLEPLAYEAASGGAQPVPPANTQEALPTGGQVSPAVPTFTLVASATTAVSLPASPSSPPPTQAQAALPSATLRPTNLPSTSAAAWNDVPIMPGARDGSEEQGSYSYTINASITDVQAYYDRMMPLAGWEPFATGEGESGNLLLMYQKDNITATIGVIDQGGNTLVLIVAE
jgi:hypothetical protein